MTLFGRTVSIRYLGRMLLIYAGAFMCGYVANWLRLPLAWMIGPMLFAVAFRLSGQDLQVPVVSRQLGQILIAASVGLAFTSDALSAMGSLIVPMIVAAIMTIIFAFIVGAFIKVAAKVDVVTATLAALPTGPVESVSISLKHGINPAPVLFTQTFRIMSLVSLIPPVIVALDGSVTDPTAVLRNTVWTPSGSLLLFALAVCGVVVAKLIRLSNPFFLGPLGATVIASVLEAPVTGYPYPVLVTAQVFLGVFIGGAFDRAVLRQLGRFIPVSIAAAFLTAFLCALLGVAFVYWTGHTWQVMILATAPGSATEMALTAKILNQGLAIVTAFHVLRIFVILPTAPLVIGATAKLAEYFEKKKAEQGA